MDKNYDKNCSVMFTVARTFSILSIVCAHITFPAYCPQVISRIYSILGSIGVVVFLFISGYYYNNKKYHSFFEMLKLKLITIGIPWIFLGSILYVYNALMNSFDITLLEWIKWIFGYKTYLYYLTILLICFIVFYQAKRILYIISIPITIVSIVLTAMGLMSPILEFFHITNYLNPFNWFGIFALGSLLRTISSQSLYTFIQKTRWLIILIFLLILLLLCVFELKVGYFSYIGIYFESVGALLIFAISTFKAFNISIFERISNNSFAIYLIHMAVIGVSGKIYNLHPITQLLAAVFIVLVSHFALEFCRFVILKLKAEKFLNPLFGFRNKKIS